MSTMRSQGLLVAVLAALVLLPNLGGPPLWDDDEPLNAACSLAMHRSGDWVVPTFNGRLRVEKPPLVNWVHLAGFAVAGPTETGARLGAALLTIGTCLLTWRIGCRLFRPDAGLWAGVAMATCLWTGVGGRAATPDAPLVFCTTLALWAFVRGACLPRADGDGWRNGPVRLPLPAALAVGAACGLGMLAKGPLALGMPLAAFLLFAWWQAILDPGRAGGRSRRALAAVGDACHGVRPLTIVLAAVAVAAPWYVAVSVRTSGDWPRGFLLVHHLGRFATPMEGHSGSTLLYYPLVVLVGMFPWSMASALIGLHTVRSAHAGGDAERSAAVGARLVAAWITAWLVPFSLAATKLPGYAWPAYPALAAATGLFVADWIREPTVATDRWMRLAWAFLAVSGVGLCIGVPFAAHRFAPGHEWLGLVGLVPLVGALLATTFQLLQSRLAASAVLGATACATVAVLMATGPAALGRVGGMRQLAGAIEADSGRDQVPVVSFFAPPSAVFYAGPLTPSGSLTDLKRLDDVVTFVQRNPEARLLVDSRFEPKVRDVLPAGYQVIDEATMLPSSRRLVLLGPADQPSTERTAATADAVPR